MVTSVLSTPLSNRERPQITVSVDKKLIASSFLLRAGHVCGDAANLSLIELCLKYLSLPAFSHARCDDQIREHARTGTFAFFEYALASWTAHLEHILEKCDSSASVPESLAHVLQAFFHMHWIPAKRKTRPPKRIQELTDHIFHFEHCVKIKDSLSSMHCLMTTNLPDLEAVHTLDLFSFLTRVRVIIEDLAAKPDITFGMQQLYGQQLYKCPRIYCKSFHEGFANMAQRDSHVERHDRSHICKITGCLYATLGYPKAEDLARHNKTAHFDIATEEDFSTLFDDGTQVDDHASGKPFVRDAEQRSRGIQQYPAIFQCTLCPKCFTRKYNLRAHLRAHTDERVELPFVCTVCGRAYARQHDCRRHEARHRGE